MDKYRKIQAHARVLVKPKKSNKLIKKFYEHFEPIYLSLCLFVMLGFDWKAKVLWLVMVFRFRN